MDTPADQKAFKEKNNFGYSLLSDPKAEMAAAFGFKPRGRSTVIINKDGKIERIIEKASTAPHAKDVLESLGK